MTDYLDSPVPAGPLRLFCFPYAGGGSALYRHWQAQLGPQVAVCPVHLPGRERRARQPRFIDMDALVAELNAELGPYLDTPHLFFGHSMGASIAYHLTRRRWADGATLPQALMLSSAAPLGAGGTGLPLGAGAAALARVLVDLGGLPEHVLGRPDWLDVILPVIRDDLLLCASDTTRPSHAEPLPVRLHLFGGYDDPIVAVTDLVGWRHHSMFEADVTLFPGGHFYLREHSDRFLAALRATISRQDYAATAVPTSCTAVLSALAAL